MPVRVQEHGAGKVGSDARSHRREQGAAATARTQTRPQSGEPGRGQPVGQQRRRKETQSGQTGNPEGSQRRRSRGKPYRSQQRGNRVRQRAPHDKSHHGQQEHGGPRAAACHSAVAVHDQRIGGISDDQQCRIGPDDPVQPVAPVAAETESRERFLPRLARVEEPSFQPVIGDARDRIGLLNHDEQQPRPERLQQPLLDRGCDVAGPEIVASLPHHLYSCRGECLFDLGMCFHQKLRRAAEHLACRVLQGSGPEAVRVVVFRGERRAGRSIRWSSVDKDHRQLSLFLFQLGCACDQVRGGLLGCFDCRIINQPVDGGGPRVGKQRGT